MKALVTGAAGFIGASLSGALLRRGYNVIGIDNLNDYYDVSLKEARLKLLQCKPNFQFQKLDISNRTEMEELFSVGSFDTVAHLAAQAGVRYSIENPKTYIESNLVGFGNILEGCRQGKTSHLIYASSSSVYGANTTLPFVETDNVDHPISLYAATKRANELMAHAYSHLYGLATTGLRFFTVYGPWGRPDMALFKFTRNILAGEPIPVYNRGQMVRDFTYIDDVVEGVIRVIDKPPKVTAASEGITTLAPWRIYNIGNSHRVQLMDYISTLERELGKKAQLSFFPMQDGDVPATEADIGKLESDFGYRPQVKVEEGIARFVAWYRAYYGIKF
ncbi:MAG TPA: NAD-dependent epimerase [Alphaproteobacteria bacterium]|nr:NAD-dependent epimerase [Alphaproteobacteria bacterium]